MVARLLIVHRLARFSLQTASRSFGSAEQIVSIMFRVPTVLLIMIWLPQVGMLPRAITCSSNAIVGFAASCDSCCQPDCSGTELAAAVARCRSCAEQ